MDRGVNEKSVRYGRERYVMAVVFFGGVLYLSGGYLLLRNVWNPANAGSWMLTGGLTLVFIVWRIAVAFTKEPRNLPQVFFPGLANCLTIARGLLICGLTGFLFSEWPPGIYAWVPGFLFCLSLLLDILDGHLARHRNETSAFGEFLDRDFDAMGTLAASFLIVHYQLAPGWYVMIGMLYYIFCGAHWLREKMGQPVYPLLSSRFRKYAAAVQFVYMGVVLMPLPLLPEPALIGAMVALPVAGGFLRDWRSVTGHGRG